jgi:hypothetical protein
VTFPFDPQQGLIVVPVALWGPTGSVVLRLALDTGATATLVNEAQDEFISAARFYARQTEGLGLDCITTPSCESRRA